MVNTSKRIKLDSHFRVRLVVLNLMNFVVASTVCVPPHLHKYVKKVPCRCQSNSLHSQCELSLRRYHPLQPCHECCLNLTADYETDYQPTKKHKLRAVFKFRLIF